MAKRLNLTKSTVTNIVVPLLEAGLIVEDGHPGPRAEAPKGSGRPPVMLRLDSNRYRVAGLELGAEEHRLAIASLSGEILHLEEYPAGGEDPLEAAARILATADRHGQLLGAGIAVSGRVNLVEGRVVESFVHELRDVALGEILRKRTGLPVLLENDANCVARGQTTTADDTVIAVLGRRGVETASNLFIGFGLLLSGEVYQGPDFGAGEFRSVLAEGPPDHQLSPPVYLHTGGSAAFMEAALTELCAHLKHMIPLLRPRAVYFAGEFLNWQREFAEAIRIVRPVPPGLECGIHPAPAGTRTTAFGAAMSFLHYLFALPSDRVKSSRPDLEWDAVVSELNPRGEG
jgi:hypothetical protein